MFPSPSSNSIYLRSVLSASVSIPLMQQSPVIVWSKFLLVYCSLFNQFSSVTQFCPTLCDPMNCSRPGLPVHHQLLSILSNPVHHSHNIHPNPCPSSGWCYPTISFSVVPLSSCPQSFPASGSFQMSQLFTSAGQSIGVLASTSVLPMKTQDWSPLGWTGWISLQSKGLSRVFSNTTVQKQQFFGTQLSL